MIKTDPFFYATPEVEVANAELKQQFMSASSFDQSIPDMEESPLF